jgi:hypothetical protein
LIRYSRHSMPIPSRTRHIQYARTLHPGTAGAPGRIQLSDDHDVLSSVDVLVNLGSDLIEGLGPVNVVSPPALSTSVETSLGLILGDEQLDVGVDELELALHIARVHPLRQQADLKNPVGEHFMGGM